MTSMTVSDNLDQGESYYSAEAERLLQMIRAADNNSTTTLCLIDEMLRGTNSNERFAASTEILNYLVSANAVVAIATHDLKLVDTLRSSFVCYHFDFRVTSGGIEFDYGLQPGILKSTNAIQLLKHLGYPLSIVERSMKSILEE